MYVVDDGAFEFSDLGEVKGFLEQTSDSWLDADEFDNFLNENNPEVVILDISYEPARVLLAVDPTTYEIAENSYIEDVINDFIIELSDYGEVDVRNTYKIVEE